MNQQDIYAEVGSPVDENVEPWVMLAYLRGRLLGGNPITLDVWNRAITLLKDGEQS